MLRHTVSWWISMVTMNPSIIRCTAGANDRMCAWRSVWTNHPETRVKLVANQFIEKPHVIKCCKIIWRSGIWHYWCVGQKLWWSTPCVWPMVGLCCGRLICPLHHRLFRRNQLCVQGFCVTNLWQSWASWYIVTIVHFICYLQCWGSYANAYHSVTYCSHFSKPQWGFERKQWYKTKY